MKNKSDIRVMLKEAGILFAITLVAGLLLGFVYQLTKEPIRLQEERAVREACQAVFSQAESFEEISFTPSQELAQELSGKGVKIGTVYAAKSSAGEILGSVIQSVSTEGYGGSIVLYVGVTSEGVLSDVSILSISETPGLGMRAEEVLLPQLSNKKAEQITYTKTGSSSESEIDAISGATITTRAVTNAVNGALSVARELRNGEGGVGHE